VTDAEPATPRSPVHHPTAGTPIRLDAGGWGRSWVVDGFGRLRQLGLGPDGHRVAVDVDPLWYPDAFPTWGGGDPYRPAPLRVTHADGTLTTRLVVERVEHRGLDDGEHLVIALRDELVAFGVELHARSHPASGVLEEWVEVEHHQDGPVVLHDYDSIAPFLLVTPDAQMVQFGGSGWADEWRWTAERLTPGTKVLDSLGGVQPHLQRSPCLLVDPDGAADETSGTALGLSIAWGGNCRFALDVRPRAEPGSPAELRLRAGANPLGAEYRLDPGVRFATPVVAWTWSSTGREAVTAAFHTWTRARVLREPDRRRPIVVNNWEATFFDFDEARLLRLMDRTAELGADLFLLDDGWFGTTHPRDDDTAGLGDWDPDPAKLPGGLAPLARGAAERGIGFGIWVEPEMVNPRSERYAVHPDWVVRDAREPREQRNQLALDPLLDAVRRFEVDVVDRTLAQDPGIAFVKWDANRPITDPGSAALGRDRQANLWVDGVRATWEVMATVAERHPDVWLMLCASGGGRTDHGTLRWFHEFWTSDNTDPLVRARMQWACGHFFPPAAMAAHVTRWGGRPLELGCAVALSGRFGIDLDLEALTGDEAEILRRAVAMARRSQDLVQQGVLHRLVSAVDGDDRTRAALMHRATDRRRAVVFAYQLEAPEGPPPRLRLRGLDPDAIYGIDRTDLLDEPEPVGRHRGAELMEDGLEWPLTAAGTARIWELVAD